MRAAVEIDKLLHMLGMISSNFIAISNCRFQQDGIYNAFVELRFSIYFLDIIWRVLILGIFLPDPSEWLGYLGKVFPPLGWLVDWFLLYPVGSTPPGQAFACFFINLIYLWQLIAVLLFAYYILNPLWQWARRQYVSLYLLIVGFRAQLGVRMDYIIQTNESILINIKTATRDAYRRQIADASRNQPIASAIGGGSADPERADAYAAAEDPATLSFGHRITAEMLRKLSHEDPAAANAIIDQQSQIEEKRLRITKQLIELGSRMGITPERLYAEMGKPSKAERFMGASTSRSMQKRWQQITSLIQVPVEYTPTYASARLKSEMRREKTKHNAELSGLFPGGDAE